METKPEGRFRIYIDTVAGYLMLYGFPAVVCGIVYTVNQGGHGWVSFIASVAITRAVAELRFGDKEDRDSWIAAAGLCLLGVVIYAVVGGVFFGVEELPDADFGDRDP